MGQDNIQGQKNNNMSKQIQTTTKAKVKVKPIALLLATMVGVIWIAVLTLPMDRIAGLPSAGDPDIPPPQGCVDERYPYTCGNYCCKSKSQCKGAFDKTRRCSPDSQSECDAGSTLCTAGGAKHSCCPNGTKCTKTKIWGKWISVCADKKDDDKTEDCGVVPDSDPPVHHYCKPGECSTIPDSGGIPICEPESCPSGESKCSGLGVTICCPTGSCYLQPGGAPSCDTSAPIEVGPIEIKPDEN